MPDVYTIAKLANLFCVSIEDLIRTGDAVVESQNFYVRRLKETDREDFCQLMLAHGFLGRAYEVLNNYTTDDGKPQGMELIWEQWYPQANHIYLLFHRDSDKAIGFFNLVDMVEEHGELSMHILSEVEVDVGVFKDFFAWVRKEYKVKAAQASVCGGQEEQLLLSLGYKPYDGLCSISLPL